MTLTGKMFGKYKLTGALGKTATGVVYKGLHTGLNREVAIKVLSSEEAQAPSALFNFKKESSNGARYSHPNIATIYDSGEEDGYHYYVMELLKPDSLKDLIERDGKIEVRLSLSIIKDVFQALVYLHKRSVAHGSLYAENVGFDYSGKAIVTHPGEVPEADKSSDMTQGGLILYEMLTGQLTSDSSNKPLKNPSKFNDEITGELDELVLQLTGQRHSEQIPSAEKVLKAFTKVELILDSRGATSAGPDSPTRILPTTKVLPTTEHPSSMALSDSLPILKILAGADYKELSQKELFLNIALVVAPILFSLILLLLHFSGTLFPQTPIKLLEHVVYPESIRASIAWKVNSPCYSYLEYYSEPDLKHRIYVSTKAETQFKADLPILTADTTYHFKFNFAPDYDSLDESTHSKEMKFKTKPEIKFIGENTETYDREVIIRWSTNVATNTKVRIGENRNFEREHENPTLPSEKTHKICLTGLKPETKYYYSIIATTVDSPATEHKSPPFSFVTKAQGNTREEAWRRKEKPESPIVYLVESAEDKFNRMTEDERAGIQRKVNFLLGKVPEELSTDMKLRVLETKTDKNNFGDRLQILRAWKTQLIKNGLKPDMMKYEKVFGEAADSYLRNLNQVNVKKSFKKLDACLTTVGSLDPLLKD